MACCIHRHPVNAQLLKRQSIAIQHERGVSRHTVAAGDRELGSDECFVRIKPEKEIGLRYQIVARPVILEPKKLSSIRTHLNSPAMLGETLVLARLFTPCPR